MRQRGFTLMELMIVMAIMAVLASISVPAIFAVRRRAEVSRTRAYLETVKLALEHYSNEFGDYPPSATQKLGFGSNGANEGIECLVLCLATKKKGGPFFTFDETVLDNQDGADKVSASKVKVAPYYQDPKKAEIDLFEIKDSWGNSFVYFHNADYQSPQTSTIGETGDRVKVVARKDKTTKSYLGLRSFQLLSLGPDGKPDAGDDGDDILVSGEN